MAELGLEARLQRLEDLEAIRDLMTRYAEIINKGWGGRVADADRMKEVFASDAHWFSKDMGIEANGVDEIARGLTRSTADIAFSQHVFLNPFIRVDGDEALGNWLMWIAVRRAEGARMVYLSEEVRYRRTAEGWRIQALVLEVAGMNAFPQAHSPVSPPGANPA